MKELTGFGSLLNFVTLQQQHSPPMPGKMPKSDCQSWDRQLRLVCAMESVLIFSVLNPGHGMPTTLYWNIIPNWPEHLMVKDTFISVQAAKPAGNIFMNRSILFLRQYLNWVEWSTSHSVSGRQYAWRRMDKLTAHGVRTKLPGKYYLSPCQRWNKACMMLPPMLNW